MFLPFFFLRFIIERIDDALWYKARDVAVILSKFTNNGRVKIRIAFVRHQKNCCYLRELTVHKSHLKFILKIRQCTKATNDRSSILCFCEVNKQTRKILYRDIVLVRKDFCYRQLYSISSFLFRKKRELPTCSRYCNHYFIKCLRRTSENVKMPECYRVERPWVYCPANCH